MRQRRASTTLPGGLSGEAQKRFGTDGLRSGAVAANNVFDDPAQQSPGGATTRFPESCAWREELATGFREYRQDRPRV